MDAATGIASVLASAWSLAAIVLLALSDPKSRRAAQKVVLFSAAGFRRCAVILALLPGVILLASKSAVAFLIWFGFATLAGWAVAAAFAPAASPRK